MKNIHLATSRRRAGALVTMLSLNLACGAFAQEAPKEGIRRLTFEQEIKVRRTNHAKFDQALKLLSEGKPAEAIPIVQEVIALEREVLRTAAPNPVEVDRPPARDPLARRPFGREGIPGVPDLLLRESRRPPTLRDFEGESLRSLELLEQLHETLGDFPAAKRVSEEIAGIVTRLVGAANWQAARSREEVHRLDHLSSLDREHAGTVDAARKATALVATSRGALGTAFCIDPQGLFLTLDEVASPPSVSVSTHLEYETVRLSGNSPTPSASVSTHVEYETLGGLSRTREERSRETSPMVVCLNLGRPDVKQLRVRVLWRDRDSRLVLLKADSKEPLPALELASNGKVAPRMEAIALGLASVGRIAGFVSSPTPTVRARPGRVISVREKGDRPWLFQLDTTPPQGYSGGPVLDEQGRVIGVIVVGLPGTDIHYIVPADATSAPFAAVAMDFEPPPLLYRDRHTPRDWTVRVYSKAPLGNDASVEIRLGRGTSARNFPARLTGNRVYTARVVPVALGEADPVGLTLESKPEPIRATVADRKVRVGETAVRLSELRRIESGATPNALAVDGRRFAGPVTGLDGLEVRQGRQGVVFDARRSPVVSIECPAPDAEPIDAEVVVKKGGNVLGRVRKALSYADPQFEADRRIDPATVGLADPPRRVGEPKVPMAVASVSREPKTGTATRDHSRRGVHDHGTAVAPEGPAAPLVRRLPGKIASLAVGGAGRYLLLQLEGQRRLALFDAERADLSGVVELADDDVLITANAEKGFAAYPKLRLLDRIDLKSGRVDRSAPFPLEATPKAVVAGSASVGPIFSVFHLGRFDDPLAQPVAGFLNPNTLALIAPRTFRRKGENDWAEAPGPVLAASDFADGKPGDYRASSSGDLFCYTERIPKLYGFSQVVTSTSTTIQYGFYNSLTLKGDVADVFKAPNQGGGLIPAAVGRSYFKGWGRFDLAGSALASFPDPASIVAVLPAHDPSYYLLVRSIAPHAPVDNTALIVVEVYSAASDRRLFDVTGLDEMGGPTGVELAPDARYHLIPAARLLVTLPPENDRLLVRRLDILRELNRLGVDEIVVTSPPAVRAVAGERFRHRVKAYAKGGVDFERSAGPEGLSVLPAGELRWEVPQGAAGQEAVAVVGIRSASGQTVLHKVHILVRRRG